MGQKKPGAYLGVMQWVVAAVMVVVVATWGAGWWWWWKEQWMHGHVWSCIARFGEHVPSGHKRPLVPLAINAVVAQLSRTLIFVPISLCLNLMSAFFFCDILLLLLISNY